MGSVIFVIAAYNLLLKVIQMAHFKFASLQGEVGQKLLKQYGFEKEIDSFVLIENQIIYSKSTAALRVCKSLHGLWKVFATLRFLPVSFRDFFYDVVAKNRYKWFGKKRKLYASNQGNEKKVFGLNKIIF